MPDGRGICVGCEHEDYYGPDFCIYNDVVALEPYDRIEIYGYPKEVFPPVDFHTATVAGDRIVIVGGLGYQDCRRPGYTPVYTLDLSQYHVSKVATSGEMPGWISKHEASYDPTGIITIKGGQIVRESGGNHRPIVRLRCDPHLKHPALAPTQQRERNQHQTKLLHKVSSLLTTDSTRASVNSPVRFTCDPYL